MVEDHDPVPLPISEAGGAGRLPDARSVREAGLPGYAELHCVSNFSFLRGASHPEELVERAQALGYTALALTDECSLAGVVRAHLKARELGLHLIVGTELRVDTPDSPAGFFTLVLLAGHRRGYGQLCELITAARARADRKGHYAVSLADLRALPPDALDDTLALLAPRRETDTPLQHGASFESILAAASWLRATFADRAWLAVELLHRLDDALWLHKLREIARLCGLPLVATGQVLMRFEARA